MMTINDGPVNPTIVLRVGESQGSWIEGFCLHKLGHGDVNHAGRRCNFHTVCCFEDLWNLRPQVRSSIVSELEAARPLPHLRIQQARLSTLSAGALLACDH